MPGPDFSLRPTPSERERKMRSGPRVPRAESQELRVRSLDPAPPIALKQFLHKRIRDTLLPHPPPPPVRPLIRLAVRIARGGLPPICMEARENQC